MDDQLMRKLLAAAAFVLALAAPAKAATVDVQAILPPITYGDIMAGGATGGVQAVDAAQLNQVAIAPTGLAVTGFTPTGTAPYNAFQVLLTGTIAPQAVLAMGVLGINDVIQPPSNITNIYSISNGPVLDAAGGNVTNFMTYYAAPTINSAYAGTMPTLYEYYAAAPSVPVGKFLSTYEFWASVLATGDGNTSGTVNEVNFRASGSTAAGGVGGTVNNFNVFATLSSGSGAGTTNNYGYYLTGAGGSGGGGTTNNWALYMNTAANWWAGNGASFFMGSASFPTYEFVLAGTPVLSGTVTHAGVIYMAPNINTASAANVANVYGIWDNFNLDATAGNITTLAGIYITPGINAAYTGTAPAVVGVQSGGLTNSTSNIVTSFAQFKALFAANGAGVTAGTVSNYSFWAGGFNSGAGSGGTINNYDFNGTTPTGGGAGTTNNYGLFVSGNGGVSGAGTTTNYAAYLSMPAGNNAQFSNYGLYITGNGGTTLAANNFAIYNASSAESEFAGGGGLWINTFAPTADNPVGFAPLLVNGTNQGVGLTTAGIYSASVFQPQNAGAVTVVSVESLPQLDVSANAITTYDGFYSAMTLNAAYTQAPPPIYAYQSGPLTNNNSQTITTYGGYHARAVTNGAGITSGTVNNYGFRADGNTGAAGAGGTVNNYGFYAQLATASNAGNTTYGVYITGNGGAASTNYALYSNSTAPSVFSGLVELQTYTIAALPTCNTAAKGAIAYVSNGQTSPTYLGAVSTTGTVVAPVFCNGSGWVYAANDNQPQRKVA